MDLSPAPVVASTSTLVPDAAEAPRQMFGDPAFYDTLATRAVAVLFLFLSTSLVVNLIRQIGDFADRAATSGTTIAIAQFLYSFCMLLFYCLAAWLTLGRSRPVAKARGIAPRLAALAGVTMLFTIPPPSLAAPPAWLLFLSAAMAVLGGILTVYVLARLGKSFSVMPQARHLVTDGPYRIVRHPLYLCEEIGTIGVFLPFSSTLTLILLVLHFAMQMTRMVYEERVLRETFPDYDAYAARTARLLPGIW